MDVLKAQQKYYTNVSKKNMINIKASDRITLKRISPHPIPLPAEAVSQ
jgi:hypothetical protein